MRPSITKTILAFIFILSCFLALYMAYGLHTEQNSLARAPESSAQTLERNKPITTQEEASLCNNNFFQDQFLDTLNTYRKQHNKNILLLDASLSLAACDHAQWLDKNNTENSSSTLLTHSGENDSTPVERCKMRGVLCSGENIAFSKPNNTPQSMFTLYQHSSTHNANLLGNYTRVGIAWSGFYQVTVFQ